MSCSTTDWDKHYDDLEPQAALGTVQPRPGKRTGLTDYRIQPLDILQITVFREPDLSVRSKVSQVGTINYPLLGALEVAGLTTREAELKIAGLLTRSYLVDPRVSVVVEQHSSSHVIVLGEIKFPGTYEIPADQSVTLLQLIGRAGGFTIFAATDRVGIIRSENGREHKIVVNVAAIMKGNNKERDVELKPGDVVSVPVTLF